MGTFSVRKTPEIFRKEVYALVADEYTVLEDYKTKDDKILFRHNCNECQNYEFLMRPHNFLRGARCPECAKSLRIKHKTMTFKKIKEKILNNKPNILNEIEFSKRYQDNDRIGRDTKIEIILKNYDNISYWITPHQLENIQSFENNIILTKELFEKRLQRRNPNLEVLEFKNSKSIATCKCKKCGNILTQLAGNFMFKSTCKYCSVRNKNSEYVEKRRQTFLKNIPLKRIDADEYIINDITEYETNRSKITFTHKVCNNTFKMTPHEFLYGKNNCPFCSKSYQEKRIRYFLLSNHIIFEEQKKFDTCRNPETLNFLPFDFYIESLNLLIEYDGEFHYFPIKRR